MDEEVSVKVSEFDYSIQNHFTYVDSISKLFDDLETDLVDQSDIQRVSSSVTFLREWKFFNYEPRIVRFVDESAELQNEPSIGVKMPQFSSVAVAQKEELAMGTTSNRPCKDFVMYVGGSVWALDWLPRVRENPHSPIKCEFIAIAAHPPGSFYHKIGASLTGRGIIQIWCMLNVGSDVEDLPTKTKSKRVNKIVQGTEDGMTQSKKPKGRPQKHPLDESLHNKDKVKRPRGRPRKHPIVEVLNLADSGCQSIQPVDSQYPGSSLPPPSIDVAHAQPNEDKVKRPRVRPNKHPIVEVLNPTDSSCQSVQPIETQYPGNFLPPVIEGALRDVQPNPLLKCCVQKKKVGEDVSISKATTKSLSQYKRRKGKTGGKSPVNDESMVVLNLDEPLNSSPRNLQVDPICQQVPTVYSSVVNSGSFKAGLSSCVQDNNASPRIMFCLAHNGKVAWDVKWQPRDMDDSAPKQRLGYLAVLLGGGSLEVWDVPGPRLIKQIYSKHHEMGTDPRFLKLKPVFKCSRVNFGGLQSIPLTVEWSSFPPHDYLLAGCHDGTVALWKFSAKNTVEESRPILCFSADTAPIKSVAWAPAVRDMESANIVATAGHGSPKIWDIRDPHRPLWDFNATSRFSYSLDWAANPRCIIQSYDDGTMRLVSLVKAAHDIAATGEHFTGTKQQGLHQFSCSSFAIWSVHISRLTGMVAYCGQDGTVKYFQLTSKAVDKDFARNRAPHFLCGSLGEEDRAIVVKTPAMNVPLFLKKPVSDVNEGSRSMRSYLSENQVKSASSKEHSVVSLDDQTHDDAVEETEMDETPTTKRKGKGKKTKKKHEVPRDEGGIVEVKSKVEEEAEAFPAKMVAIHKVRWNMNKGSERWLCSGGAAGIVRCQEIKPPNFDKRLGWQSK